VRKPTGRGLTAVGGAGVGEFAAAINDCTKQNKTLKARNGKRGTLERGEKIKK